MLRPLFQYTKKSWPLLLQCAKSHKKPRWLPVAKSKIFRIPKRPVVSEEERVELLRINNNYKTQMRAIRQYYHDEMIMEKSSRESKSSEQSLLRETEEWERCIALNDQWNAKVAVERENRRSLQLDEMEKYAFARIEAKDKELRENIAKASEEIRKQKEASATFITPETLDAAIEHALANQTDYNFAIDSHGQQYLGRETPAIVKK